jgi:hypothetical protein
MGLTVRDDLLEYMPDIDTVGYELRALLGHGAQESFPFFVDERHIVKVYHTGGLVLAPPPALPALSQFVDPNCDEAALQNPPPLG